MITTPAATASPPPAPAATAAAAAAVAALAPALARRDAVDVAADDDQQRAHVRHALPAAHGVQRRHNLQRAAAAAAAAGCRCGRGVRANTQTRWGRVSARLMLQASSVRTANVRRCRPVCGARRPRLFDGWLPRASHPRHTGAPAKSPRASLQQPHPDSGITIPLRTPQQGRSQTPQRTQASRGQSNYTST
jgi:hypothetical protein